MDPWHIDERHMKLQTWFNKVLSHPVLGKTEEVKIFLEEFKLSETNINNLLQNNANNNNNSNNNVNNLSSGDEDLVKLDLGRMGYLYKLHHGQWKKGWFVLRNDVLFKYRSHTVIFLLFLFIVIIIIFIFKYSSFLNTIIELFQQNIKQTSQK